MNKKHPRVAAVTGGGSGIGLAVAARLRKEGFETAILGRDAAKLRRAAETIGARAYAADVRDEAACRAAFARIAADLGPLRVVVANAGVGGENHAGDGDRWREIVDTNLHGTYFTLRAAMQHLAPGPDKCDLVIMSSILGKFGVPGYTAYCASKTALIGLVRSLALETACDPQYKHVMVNAICPGWVETDMAIEGLRGFAEKSGATLESARADAMARVPLGRMSKPEDVAALTAWLVSGECAGVTGQSLNINNGAFME